MAAITLYHWEPNANSGKPMLALEEKGVAWDSHYINMLTFDQHQPEYLAVNPQGTIPAMTHGDLVLTESTAIMEYVDEAFAGPALMPADPQDRWRVRWWMKFMDQWLGPSFSMIGWCTFVGPSLAHKSEAEREAMIARIPLPERRVAWRKAMFAEFVSPWAWGCWKRSWASGSMSEVTNIRWPTSTSSIPPTCCRWAMPTCVRRN